MLRERQVVKLKDNLSASEEYASWIGEQSGYLFVIEEVHDPIRAGADPYLITVRALADGRTVFLHVDEVEPLDGEQDI